MNTVQTLWSQLLNGALLQSMKHLMRQSGCDLVVVDSSFTVVSIDLEEIGALLVGLPYHLDYPSLGFWVWTLEEFGEDGIN